MTNTQNAISPNYVDFDFTGPEPITGRITIAGDMMALDSSIGDAFRANGVKAVRVECEPEELRLRPVEPTDEGARPVTQLETGACIKVPNRKRVFDGFTFDGFWHQDPEWRAEGFCFGFMPLQIQANRDALAAAAA